MLEPRFGAIGLRGLGEPLLGLSRMETPPGKGQRSPEVLQRAPKGGLVGEGGQKPAPGPRVVPRVPIEGP